MDTGYVVKSQSDGWIQRKRANQTGGYKEKEPIRRVDTRKRSQSDGEGWIHGKGVNKRDVYKVKVPIRGMDTR